MVTPFTWLASRVSINRKWLRPAAGTALFASVLIIVTGATVRVTGSGLGCDTWPYCTADTLAPTSEMGIHGAIEFGNRLLAVVLCLIVGWLIIVARFQREKVPSVTRWAWAQFWVIVLNAVMGGITVWTELNPYVVAGHFGAAMLLLAATTVTWHRVTELETKLSSAAGPSPFRRAGMALFIATTILVVLGTLVTGTGPHAGDSADIPRMPFDWNTVSRLHGLAAIIVTLIAVSLWITSRQKNSGQVHRRLSVFLAVLLLQGATGIIQVMAGLPEAVVVLHLLGAAIVWIGAIRILLDTRIERQSLAPGVPTSTPAPA